MKEVMVHACGIAVLDHVDVMTGQDHGLDQDLLVPKVASGTKEMTFMMITALTEEENMTGMKEGVVIQWSCYTLSLADMHSC
jgi:hypothetical protein